MRGARGSSCGAARRRPRDDSRLSSTGLTGSGSCAVGCDRIARCGDWRLGHFRNRGRERHRRDEAIAFAGDRLHMSRLGGQVAERFAKLVDRGIQAVVEVHKRVFAPKPPPHFLARHQFRWPFQKHHQYLKWLGMQLDADSLFTKLSRDLVYLERSEAKHAGLLSPVSLARFQSSCLWRP